MRGVVCTPSQLIRKIPCSGSQFPRRLTAVVGLGRRVSGGTRPRLSCGRSWLQMRSQSFVSVRSSAIDSKRCALTRTTRRFGNDIPIEIASCRLPSSMIVSKSAVVERLGYEIERPRLVQHRWRGEGGGECASASGAWFGAADSAERTVHAVHVLVVPRMAFGA